MTCYNPKIVTVQKFRKIDEKTGEIYQSRRVNFKHNYEDPTKDPVRIIPCGHCEGCRIDKAKDWATRAYLEAQKWPKNCFLTLTYSNDNLPRKRTLKSKDLQDFWKKLRHEQKEPIKYLACGEYGPKTLRPHYHAAVFNYWPTDTKLYKKNQTDDELYTSKTLDKIWGKGYVIIGRLTYESAAYIARYVTKKAYGLDHNFFLKANKEKEFTRSSNRPGLAAWAFNDKKTWEKIKRNNGVLIKTKNGVTLAKIPQYLMKKWKENENRDDYYNIQDKKYEQQIKDLTEQLNKTSLNYWHYQKMKAKSMHDRIKKLKRKKGDLTNLNEIS